MLAGSDGGGDVVRGDQKDAEVLVQSGIVRELGDALAQGFGRVGVAAGGMQKQAEEQDVVRGFRGDGML